MGQLLRLVIVLLISICALPALADQVFRNVEYDVSFRYPDNWSEREAQLSTTVVLLYADDGAGATCNLTATEKRQILIGRSERELEALRKANHTKEYFINQIRDSYKNLKVIRYWRGAIGQKDAGLIEIERDLIFNDASYRYREISGSTFANERRYTLLCNGLARQHDSITNAFDYIRNTLAFTQ